MRDYSYQLYSSRNFPPLADTLAMVAGLGYRQVEGYGALYSGLEDAQALRDQLDAHGLAMPTAHVALDLIESRPDTAIAIAGTLGVEVVLAPFVGADGRPRGAAEWAAFGRRLAEAGKPLADAGLTFGWHNHDFEFEDLGGTDRPLDLILQGGDDLRLELDVAWVEKGGQDPLHWIAKYADRLVSAHIKDIAPDGGNADEDGWADVGHGTMDWAAILGALEQTGTRYFIVEHDNPSDDRRFAERSIAALGRL